MIACLVAPVASAGDRVRLDREDAEFRAQFFAIVHGSRLSGEDDHVNCRRRIAVNVRLCHVSWEAKGEINKARAVIAARERDPVANLYRVTYRIRTIDKTCALTKPVSRCTSTERGRETYTGG
jgi:hypothetical protein